MKRSNIWHILKTCALLLALLATGTVRADTDTYLVIDLSGGTSAMSYPVSSLSDVPDGGWTDEYKTGKLVMRKVPAGTFTIEGRSSDYAGATGSGLYTVKLTKDFYIGVFEVTQRQWELVMGNRPSYFINSSYYASRPVEQVSYYGIRDNPTNTDDSAVSQPNNREVNAASFIGKLRAKTRLSTLDLPTESQWEYACRAGTTTPLNTSGGLASNSGGSQMDAVGRYWHNGGCRNTRNGDTSAGTAKVGSYLPNAWGLYDMHGNVDEWCFDWHGMYPWTVTDPRGVPSGRGRVLRGGCWYSLDSGCHSAYRSNFNSPSDRDNGVGFRVARTLPTGTHVDGSQ